MVDRWLGERRLLLVDTLPYLAPMYTTHHHSCDLLSSFVLFRSPFRSLSWFEESASHKYFAMSLLVTLPYLLVGCYWGFDSMG